MLQGIGTGVLVIRWGDDDSDAISLFVLACRKLPRGTVSLIPVEKI
jgi:hypothetical protein